MLSMDPAAAPAYERLARLALELGGERELSAAYRRLRVFVEAEVPVNGLFVSSYDPATQVRTAAYAYAEGVEMDHTTLPPMPNTGSPHARACETGETIVTQDFQEAMSGKPRHNVGLAKDPRLPQSSIVVPMKVQGRILGAMEIQSVEPSAFRPEHVATLEMAAHLAGLAVSNAHALERERATRAQAEARAVELEESVRERLRELASKNRELEAFSFTVAHDLRAPLRALLSLSETLLRKSDLDPARVRADIDAIHQSSDKMARLVTDLLTFARTNEASVRRGLVDMTHVAREVLQDLEGAEPDRKTDLRVQENLYVEADPALLRILLDNLLGNAWKFTSKKPITTIRVGARLEQGEVRYFVEDHGVGYDPREAARLFGAFQRLHKPNEYEGTGLGLATAQRIVKRHGGRIWGETKPGAGATFWFTLPPVRAKADG
jgi:signal transduction histidine kinase